VNSTIYDEALSPSADELDGGRFWTMNEIKESVGKHVLTPNFEHEFLLFFSHLL